MGVHNYFGHRENLFSAENVYSDDEDDSYEVLIEKQGSATADIQTLTLL